MACTSCGIKGGYPSYMRGGFLPVPWAKAAPPSRAMPRRHAGGTCRSHRREPDVFIACSLGFYFRHAHRALLEVRLLGDGVEGVEGRQVDQHGLVEEGDENHAHGHGVP